jgi:hypothetical protein
MAAAVPVGLIVIIFLLSFGESFVFEGSLRLGQPFLE